MNIRKIMLITGGILIPLFLLFILIMPMIFMSAIITTIPTTTTTQIQTKSSYVKYNNVNLSEDVLRWKPIVEEYAFKNEMDGYVDLILAVMMQESGGRYLDLMQCSEGGFNTRYSKAPNSITDPIYSIDCGIKELKQALKNAGVRDKADITNIKVALQSYNYGPGYVQYARESGGYSEKNARDFSVIMAQKMNWSGYGDPLYVEHVLRYLDISLNNMDNMSHFYASNERFEDLMNEALKHQGKRYFLGPITFQDGVPITFDCSSLTQWCYKSIGIDIPRTAQQQYDFMGHVPIEDAVPGDLIFFKKTYNCGDYITHVAIYQGGMEVFHAGDPVGYANINTSYWLDKIVCAGRIK